MKREFGAIEVTIGIVVLLLIAFIGYGMASNHALYPHPTATSTPSPTASKSIHPTILPLGSPPATISVPPAPSVSPKPSITPISGCWTTTAGTRICANATK